MIKTETLLVTADDTRYPKGRGSKKDKCFYCKGKLGQPHDDGCVCAQKTVVLDVTMQILVTVPLSHTEDDIHYHYNDYTCTLNKWFMIEDHMSIHGGCWCNMEEREDHLRIQYVRDATLEDEELLGVRSTNGLMMMAEDGIRIVDEGSRRKKDKS